jgi:pimeloyl-ACP methyl ester carboxylesterase
MMMTRHVCALTILIAIWSGADATVIARQTPMPPLHVEVSGAGDPIVLLHGFGASTYTWRDIAPSLAQTHRVYALDLKGFGQSPKPKDGRYAAADQAALVVQFLADRQLKSVTLVGHSFGGGIALAAALELERTKPGVLKSLILISAAAYRQPLPGYVKVLRMPLIGPLLQRVVPATTQVRTVLRLAYYNDDLIPDAAVETYAAALKSDGGRSAARETARTIVPKEVDDISTRYSFIQTPALLIWGRHDEIIPLAMGERLKQAFQNARLVVIENAGHQVQEETPEPVRQAINGFLTAKK